MIVPDGGINSLGAHVTIPTHVDARVRFPA